MMNTRLEDRRGPQVCLMSMKIIPGAFSFLSRFRVALAMTGTWFTDGHGQRFSIWREDLDAIVRNFKSSSDHEMNVPYDQTDKVSWQGAGSPLGSSGRIVDLDPPELHVPSGEFMLYGRYEPTQQAHRLIVGGYFRYIRPVIDWLPSDNQTEKAGSAVLSSAVLTNSPFREEMPKILLSDFGPTIVSMRADSASGLRPVRPFASMVKTFMKSSDPKGDLLRAAKAWSKETNVDFRTALSEVSRICPDLTLLSRRKFLATSTI